MQCRPSNLFTLDIFLRVKLRLFHKQLKTPCSASEQADLQCDADVLMAATESGCWDFVPQHSCLYLNLLLTLCHTDNRSLTFPRRRDLWTLDWQEHRRCRTLQCCFHDNKTHNSDPACRVHRPCRTELNVNPLTDLKHPCPHRADTPFTEQKKGSHTTQKSFITTKTVRVESYVQGHKCINIQVPLVKSLHM